MREIKFRVWVEYEFEGKEYKEMCGPEDWFLLTQCGEVMQYGPTKTPCGTKEYKVIIPLFYTGLKDKNGVGNEAYIGDIAKDEHGQVFVIEWDYPLLARLQEIWFEVIGNTHQNPELMESA